MNDHASGVAPGSGGAVDPAAIDDLVAANRILADQGVLDGYRSRQHPPPRRSRPLPACPVPNLRPSSTAADIMEFDLDSNPVDRQGRLMYIERYIHGEIYKARPT